MSIEKLRPTFTFTEDRLRELQAVIPEAFADGKINWDVLREALGEHLEEENQEHFGLSWPGKREARRLAAMPSKGTLVPQPGEGINEENTHNLFIEGDNLEVLKLLQKSYAGKVKMIYIDPPYNTGNDFVYPDDYSEPLESYLKRTGQIDEAGHLLTTNSQTSGRYHSNWLNLIYPRLLLARTLLNEDGVIFVSIDDNEVHNLRLLFDEIFGAENFIAQFIWEKKYTTSNNISGVSGVHEYITCYGKNLGFLDNSILRLPYTDKARARYSNPDNDFRGDWMDVSYHGPKSPRERPNLNYPIIHPKTKKEIYPLEKSWAYERSVHEQHVNENRLWWGKEFTYSEPRLKKFINEIQGGLIPRTLLPYEEVGGTATGRDDLRKLFGEGEAVFDNPKPVNLIIKLLQMSTLKNSLILDFFAGSGTTAQAIFEINKKDEGNRHFVLVQLPELTENKTYPTIAEICKERIRRTIRKLQTERTNQMNLNTEEYLGFKVLRLDRSHFKDWQPYTENDPAQLGTLFDHFETPLVENWQKQALLTEILLLQGFPLDATMLPCASFLENDVLGIWHDFCAHSLYVCLDEKISAASVEAVNILRPQDVFVCLDSALSDEAKLHLSDRCNLKVI